MAEYSTASQAFVAINEKLTPRNTRL